MLWVNASLEERRRARPVDRETDLEDQVDFYLVRAYGGVMRQDGEVRGIELVDNDDYDDDDEQPMTDFEYELDLDHDSGYYSASRSGSESGDDDGRW